MSLSNPRVGILAPAGQIGGIERVSSLQAEILGAIVLKSGVGYTIFGKPYVPLGKLIGEISANKVDLLIVHGFTSFLPIIAFVMKLFLGVRVIWQPHYHPFNFNSKPILSKIFFIVFNLIPAIFFDFIICATETERIFFRNFNKKVVVVPWPITRRYEPAEKNLTINSKFALFIGRNDKNKNLRAIIDNVTILKKYVDKVILVTDRHGAVQVPQNDIFEVLSGISDSELAELYRRCSLTIVPSLYESFSLVALEAIACGKPVVISNGVRISEYEVVQPFLFNLQEIGFEKCVKLAVESQYDLGRVRSVQEFFSIDAYRQRLMRVVFREIRCTE